MEASNVSEELRRELGEIAQANGCELAHVEFIGGTLRITLDHPESVTLDHCQSVSKESSAFLDVADFGPGRYTLEVTSPGLDRELFGPRDFERFTGRDVTVTWKTPEMKNKRTISGQLAAYHEDKGGWISVTPDGNDESCSIHLSDLKSARLRIEW